MPPTSLPTSTSFPPALNAIIHPSPPPTQPSIANAMIFLPGLGDTSANFSSFAAALNLPETLCVTLNPPFPLPLGLGPGSHWSDDLAISTTGELDATESGFNKAVKLIVEEVVLGVLIQECGFAREEIQVFGYGQGASLALSVALDGRVEGLGGVVAVGGALPLGVRNGVVGSGKARTPVIVLGGSQGEVFGDGGSRVKRIQDRFEFVEVEKWKRREDGMPKNREEVLPMMRFWGRRLRSRRGVPEGAVEIR